MSPLAELIEALAGSLSESLRKGRPSTYRRWGISPRPEDAMVFAGKPTETV
jgi:hypothetical protein